MHAYIQVFSNDVYGINYDDEVLKLEAWTLKPKWLKVCDLFVLVHVYDYGVGLIPRNLLFSMSGGKDHKQHALLLFLML